MNDISMPWAQTGAAAEPAIRREPFAFTGNAKEYFGIWIVNILLTIVTLGIYSAWAKVRRLRYFYGNTRLADAGFDYHARPRQILIGRAIVLVMLAAYNIALTVVPVVGLFLAGLFILATPWFVYRGMRFSARVTSYRNVRFDFKGGYGGALLAFLIGPIIATISLGILVPLASRWAWRYQMNNLTYGGRPISCDPRLGAFFRQWWPMAILVVILVIVVPAGIAAATSSITGIGFGSYDELILQILVNLFPLMLAAFIAYALVALFYQAGARNVALNATTIDARHSMVSTVGRRRFIWISVSNVIVTFLTLGLMRPWAAVRMAKYIAASTALDVSGRLDDFVSSVRQEGGATGAEFMDFEGFDLGF